MRLERILVGVDFSPESEAALSHALHLARNWSARLILAHVLPLPSDLVEDSPYDPLFRAQGHVPALNAVHRNQAAELLQEVTAGCAALGVEAESVLVDDNPSDGLARTADELAADLLVLGTHGRTGLKRFLLGSVAERAVRLAAISAMVARGSMDDQRDYRRILVATDFSPSADAALDAARVIAPGDARIDLVHCWQTLVMPRDTVVEPGRTEIERAITERGRRLVASLEDRRVSFVAIESPAAEGIRRRAEEEACDLIVTGSHGHRGVHRWLLGSVTETVVRHAPCSVLVVRPPDGERPAKGA